MAPCDGAHSDRQREPDPGSRRGDRLTAGLTRPKTVYVDWAEMEAGLSTRGAHALATATQSAASQAAATRPRRARPRLVTTVDSQVSALRRNVQDSARTVLTWVATLADKQGGGDIDRVLRHCLRPGPDVQSVNYAAMAREIQSTLGVAITAKRVRTAIEHLRRHRETAGPQTKRSSVTARLDALRSRLRANHATLVNAESDDRHCLRRSIAVEVLAAVRCAAGRLIENGYGEHIPDRVDLETLEDRYLDFVRYAVSDRVATGRDEGVDEDLHRLLVTLCEDDQSGEHDMRLVVDGARVVAILLGPDSLAGLLAQLNVLVAGRQLLDSELYCAEMTRLAEAAAGLHDDAQTRRFMHWVRRQPEENRLPSALRVSSYCLNNATTHILERVFQGELPDDGQWLARAEDCFGQMKRRDGGFRLVRTTEVLLHTVKAALSGRTVEVEAHFAGLGRDMALEVLQDLAEFDNCVDLCRAAESHAVRAIPDLNHQMIRLG